jgi:prepilin-type N-terminal cleavage/methylation domain-containing protein
MNPHVRSRKSGFTLVELLVVIAIITLLIAILLPALSKAREQANRVSCMSNLRSIGQAMYQYANENKGNFPRGVWFQDFSYSSVPDHTWNGLRGFTDPIATDPFNNASNLFGDNVDMPWVKTERPGDNDVTGALFILLRMYKMPAKTFICPSCDQYFPDNFGGLTAMDRSNFTSPYNLGYSVSLPFPWDSQSAQALHYIWGTTCNPDFALMADLSPGESLNGPNGPNCVVSVSGLYGGTGPQTPHDAPSIQRRANSNNHYKAGQNVLYGDGRAEWHINAFAGAYQDNIYTAQGSTTATTGTNNIWTGIDQLPLNGQRLPLSPTDSIMQPSQTAWQIGVGIGIE